MARLAAVDTPFDRQDKSFQITHRRIADPDRRVIGERHFGAPPPGKQLQQLLRARPDQIVNLQMSVGIQRMHMRA